MASNPKQPKSYVERRPLNPELQVGSTFSEGVRGSEFPNEPIKINLSEVPSSYIDAFVSVPQNRTLTAKQLQYQAAEEQTRIGNLTSGLWNVATSFVAGVAKTPGYALGRYGDGWVEGVEGIKESIDADRYLPESAELGNVWTKLASGAYWSETVANTVGDSLSYFAPGAILKGINVGGKITRLLKIGNPAKPSGLANALNSGASVAVNTYLESMAEGHEGYKNIKAALEQERAQGLNNFSDQLIEEKASAGANATMRGNLIPLLVSNLLFDKLFFSSASTLGKPSADKLVKAIVSGDTAALKTSVLEGFKLSTLNPVKSAYRGLTGSPKGFWYRNALIGSAIEGGWEENLQSAVSRTIKDQVLAGKDPGVYNSEGLLDVLDKAYGRGFDDEQLESVVLGGLLGVTMSIPGTLSDVKTYNESLFGRQDYTPSKFARAFGRQARPKVEGLISAVTNMRTATVGTMSSEQFKQAFMDANGKLDENKLIKALKNEEDKVLKDTAVRFLILKDRETQLKNATEDERDALVRQFASQDLLESILPLLTQENGSEIFSKIVDDMIESKRKDYKEKTGIDSSLFGDKEYIAELKEIGRLSNADALLTIKNHNNVIPDYGKVEGDDKFARIQYEQALLNKRIITNVQVKLQERELAAKQDALNAVRQKGKDLEETVANLEASNQLVLDLQNEIAELKKEQSRLNNQDAVNVIIAEQPGLTVADAKDYRTNRKKEIGSRISEINQELKTAENKKMLAEVAKAKKSLEDTKKAEENLLRKVDESKALLGGTYVPEKYSDDTPVASFSGRVFNGIQDLANALFDPEFVDADYAVYIKNRQLQESIDEKKDDLKKIASPFFKKLFSVATSLPEIVNVPVPVIGEDGAPVKREDGTFVTQNEQRNFYYSAQFKIGVINSTRSGFEAIELDNGKFFAGKSMRLVDHKPASDSNVEHLVFKEESYSVNEDGTIEPGPDILFKLYADGMLELYIGNTLLKTYEQFEYKLGSDALAEFSFDSDVSILDDAIFDKQIEEHKNVVLGNALRAEYANFTKNTNFLGKQVQFDNLPSKVLEAIIGDIKELDKFRALRDIIQKFEYLLRKGDEGQKDIIAELKRRATAASKKQDNQSQIANRAFSDAIGIIEESGLDALREYVGLIKVQFDKIQEEFGKSYKQIKDLVNSPIADGTELVKKTKAEYDILVEKIFKARSDIRNLERNLADSKNMFRLTPMMESFKKHFDLSFETRHDKIGLIAVTNILTKYPIVPDQELPEQTYYDLFSELFDLQFDGRFFVYASDNPEVQSRINEIRQVYKDAINEYTASLGPGELTQDQKAFIYGLRVRETQELEELVQVHPRSMFIKNLLEDLNEIDDIKSFVNTLAKLNFEQFHNALTEQREETALLRSNIEKSKELYKQADDLKKEFEEINKVILSFFNPSRGMFEYHIRTQKVYMAEQLFEGQDAKGTSAYTDPYDNEKDVYEAEERIRKNYYLPQYALIRTAGNFKDFYQRYVNVLEEFLKAKYPNRDLGNIGRVIFENAKGIAKYTFNYAELEQYVNNVYTASNGAVNYKSMLDDWRYYAFMQNEPLVGSNVGSVYVSTANIKSFPQFVQDTIKFYVERNIEGAIKGFRYTIAEIESLGIPLSAVTDVKALVVSKPDEFLKNIQEEKSYFRSADYGNDLIYMSIRDYSNYSAQQLSDQFPSGTTLGRTEAERTAIIEKDLKEHKQFLSKVLTETVPTTVHKFQAKKPGALDLNNVESDLTVVDALPNGTKLTTNLFEFPSFTKTKGGKSSSKVTVKNNIALANGYLYLKTNGTFSMVKPTTLAKTGQIDQMIKLLQALTYGDDVISKQDRGNIISFLNNAIRVNKAVPSRNKTNFHFRLAVDKNNNLESLEIGDKIISAEKVQNLDDVSLRIIENRLSEKLHNFKSSLFKNNKPFTEYRFENNTVEKITHDSYLDYLFNPKSGSPKGYVANYGVVRNVPKMLTLFTIPRNDAHAYLGVKTSVERPQAPKAKAAKIPSDPMLIKSTDQEVEIEATIKLSDTDETPPSVGNKKILRSGDKQLVLSGGKLSLSGLTKNFNVGQSPVGGDGRYIITKNNSFISIAAIAGEDSVVVREYPINSDTGLIDPDKVKISKLTLEQVNNLIGPSNPIARIKNLKALAEADIAVDASIDLKIKQQEQEAATATKNNAEQLGIQPGDRVTLNGRLKNKDAADGSFEVQSIDTANDTLRLVSVDYDVPASKVTKVIKQGAAQQQVEIEPEIVNGTTLVKQGKSGKLIYTIRINPDGSFTRIKGSKEVPVTLEKIKSMLSSGYQIVQPTEPTQPDDIETTPQPTTPTMTESEKVAKVRQLIETEILVNKVVDFTLRVDILIEQGGLTEAEAVAIVTALEQNESATLEELSNYCQ